MKYIDYCKHLKNSKLPNGTYIYCQDCGDFISNYISDKKVLAPTDEGKEKR